MIDEISDTALDIQEALDAQYIGKEIIVEAVVLGKSGKKSIPKSIEAWCTKCGERVRLELDKNIEALRFWLTDKKGGIFKLVQLECEEKCRGSEIHSFHLAESEVEINYRILLVDGFKAKSTDPLVVVHLIGRKVPRELHQIRLTGTLMRNPKTKDLEFVANNFESSKDMRESFSITDSDKDSWAHYFGRDKNVHLTIAPGIRGETREIGKLACALTAHSIKEIPDPFEPTSDPIVGVLRTLLAGGTKIGKSETAKSYSSQGHDSGGLFYAKYLNAEMASRTGLSYAIDTEKGMIRWGELALNDGGMVILDGIDKFREEDMGQLREVLHSGVIVVSRILKGEAPARTRIVSTANPKLGSLKHYPFAVQALKDLTCFKKDGTEMTRWDLFIAYREDVPAPVIARGEPIRPPVPAQLWYRHVLWAHTRKPGDIIYEAEAKAALQDATEDLLNRYMSTEYPLVHNGIRVVLVKLAVAHSALVDSTDSNHEKVIVKKESVEAVKSFVERVLQSWDLPKYLENVERPAVGSELDYIRMISEFDMTDYVVLSQLAEAPRDSTDLESPTGLKPQTIRQEHFSKLSRLKLIEETYGRKKALTPLGCDLVRRLLMVGVLPRVVESLSKPLQGTLEDNGIVEKNSTTQQPSTPPPYEFLHDETRIAALIDDYAKGMRSPDLEQKHGESWVQHAKERGIIPTLGGASP